jgi:hypothetical protein
MKDDKEFRQMEKMNEIIYENFKLMKEELENLDLQIKYAKLKKSKQPQVFSAIVNKSD